MVQRPWVQFLAPDTEWTFFVKNDLFFPDVYPVFIQFSFHIGQKIVLFVGKAEKDEKRCRGWPIKNILAPYLIRVSLLQQFTTCT